MELHNAQKVIAKDNHRFRVLACGRRFGKTMLAVEEMIGVAVSGKEKRIVYYAPTRDDAREITWNILIKKCDGIITYKNEQRLEVKLMTIDGGESSIVLHGWESVQERGKGRGLANDFIVLDEVAFYRNFFEGWNEVLSPTLIDRRGSALFISTPKGFNHFFELYEMERKDQNYKSFHFTTYDNPFIPVEEIEREKISKPEDTFAQEYLADFRKVEGLVYKEFDRNIHIKDHIPKNVVEKMAGVDFGFNNPTAIVEIWKTNDGVYYVMNEWYKTNKTNTEVVEYAKSLDVNVFYPDPAEPDRIQEMRNAGLNCREVNKDVAKGIDSVRELLRSRRLFIHYTCKNFIWEIENYQYKEKKAGSSEPEEPIKENDHILDATRYCLHMQAPINSPMERILKMTTQVARRNLSIDENI